MTKDQFITVIIRALKNWSPLINAEHIPTNSIVVEIEGEVFTITVSKKQRR